jgi:CRP/FNR family transcriptional regulator, nitrogen oxide reductase regulator
LLSIKEVEYTNTRKSEISMAERRKNPLELNPVPADMCSTDLRLEILGRLPFFANLPLKDLVGINERFHEKGFSANKYIYYEGDPASSLFVVADGRVKLIRHTLSGKDVVLDLLTPGEFFGSLSHLEQELNAETAQAQTDVCILTIEKSEFRKILDTFPGVALAVLEITSRRLNAAQEMIRQISVYSIEKRLAFTLLKLADKFGKNSDVGLLIEVPLSRDDLAQMTGTTTESASRVLSQFHKQGLIESGRQWVAVTDRLALERLAGD